MGKSSSIINTFMEVFMYDVIIIGGGPSGLTAGLYAARARLKALLIENPLISPQAMITDTIENYPGFPEGIDGPSLIEKIRKQAEEKGLEFDTGEVKLIKCANKTWNVNYEEKTLSALSLIVASGARPKELNILGEEKFKGKGISYCAVCDAAFFKDKDIVVIGGGDTAIKETLFLTKFVKSIKLIHRRDRLRAAKILQEEILKNKKVEILWSSIAKEIVGDNRVNGIRVVSAKDNKETLIPCSGVFIFVGYIPNTDFVKGVINFDNEGYIITDINMHTSCEGVFACGDCRQKTLRQIITACGDGAVAAYESQQYIEKIKSCI